MVGTTACTVIADEFAFYDEPSGMLEIVTVDGRARVAFRQGVTIADFFALIDRRAVEAVRQAQRKHTL